MPLPQCAAVAPLLICAVLAPRALAGGGQPYDFTINTAASGLAADASFSISTAGTLIGNWDPATNPTGTRTKPGINPFSPFGPTENLPVMLDLGAGFGGAINSATAGGFGMTLNPGGGLLAMSGFSASLLSGGPVELPLTVSFLFEGFRTRNPTSTFIGGIPLEIPLGSATISAMSVEQVGESAPGVLVPTGPGTFDFFVSPIVTLNATLSFLGNEITIPGTPVPFPIGGQLSIVGESAMLLSVQPIVFGQVFNPDLALPEFPFDLPTILPPGDVASLLLNLAISEIGVGIDGTQTLSATGTLVPAPGAWAAGIVAMAAAGRRRRGTTLRRGGN